MSTYTSQYASVQGAPAQIWGPVVTVVVIAIANFLVWVGNEHSWAHRRLCCCLPTIFFASNRRAGVDKHQRPSTYWALDILDPAHLVQSHCLSTPLLLLLHAATLLYAVATILVDIVVDYYMVGRCPEAGADCPTGPYPEWLTYFTNWSLVLLGVAAVIALANTARHQKKERHNSKLFKQFVQPRGPSNGHTNGTAGPAAGQAAPAGPADVEAGRPHTSQRRDDTARRFDQHPLTKATEKWDALSVAHLLVMETATSAAFFLTFWFWVGLVAVVKSGFELEPSTFMAHGGNVVFAGLQVAFTRLPMVSYHFQLLLAYGSLYLVFLWIYGGTTGVWRYGLDWNRARPVGAFVLLPFHCFLMFLIWYLVAKLREKAVCATKHVVERVREH